MSERRKNDQTFGLDTAGGATQHSWRKAGHTRQSMSAPAGLLAGARPSLLCPRRSTKAQNGFSTKRLHLGLFPGKWLCLSTNLERFISTWKGFHRYRPYQLLPTGRFSLRLKVVTGVLRVFQSCSVKLIRRGKKKGRALTREAGKDKKLPLGH